MTNQSPRGNSFRAAILRGERPALVVGEKKPRLDPTGDALDGAAVARSETRRGNHRGQDRHRLTDETATALYEGVEHRVEVVNLSAGGAMIRSDLKPRLWDMIELRFGEGSTLECAVRWLREDLIGVEFAHETRIECDPESRAALLLDVIRRSFPDVEVELGDKKPDEAPQEEVVDLGNRAERRHPLIWTGEIHSATGSNPVRLRNISSGGALVDADIYYPVGSEVLLDLGQAGQFFATVSWVHGEQAGLKFKDPFDLACLAKSRPEVTPPRWVRPSFLDNVGEASPWDELWRRSSIAEIRSELEGFLKR
jgi:hypothetical protein